MPFSTVPAVVAAILLGFVIGGVETGRRTPRSRSGFGRIIRALATISGLAGMLFFGGLLGAAVASMIVPLVATSERETFQATTRGRRAARILLLGVGVLVSVAVSLVVDGAAFS